MRSTRPRYCNRTDLGEPQRPGPGCRQSVAGAVSPSCSHPPVPPGLPSSPSPPGAGPLRAVKGDQQTPQRESPSLGFPKQFSALQSPGTGAPPKVNATERWWCHAHHIHAPAGCQVLSSRGVTRRMDRGSRNPTAVTVTGPQQGRPSRGHWGALGPVSGPAVPPWGPLTLASPRHTPPEAHQQLSLDESRRQPEAEGNGRFQRRLSSFWK